MHIYTYVFFSFFSHIAALTRFSLRFSRFIVSLFCRTPRKKVYTCIYMYNVRVCIYTHGTSIWPIDVLHTSYGPLDVCTASPVISSQRSTKPSSLTRHPPLPPPQPRSFRKDAAVALLRPLSRPFPSSPRKFAIRVPKYEGFVGQGTALSGRAGRSRYSRYARCLGTIHHHTPYPDISK